MWTPSDADGAMAVLHSARRIAEAACMHVFWETSHRCLRVHHGQLHAAASVGPTLRNVSICMHALNQTNCSLNSCAQSRLELSPVLQLAYARLEHAAICNCDFGTLTGHPWFWRKRLIARELGVLHTCASQPDCRQPADIYR